MKIKADGTRYFVQVNIDAQGWTTYVPKSRRSGYTLTADESFAYMATLPATVKVRGTETDDHGNRVYKDANAYYRVVKSVCQDGMITQTLAA